MESKILFNRNKDKIAIIAPSSARKNQSDGSMDIDESFEELAKIKSILESYGFNICHQQNIFQKNDLAYFAAPKEQRLAQLKQYLADPDVKIIAAFRGGYGAGEIAYDLIDFQPSGNKILIGFSDITVLHSLFNQKYGLASIHGALTFSYRKFIPKIIDILQGKKIKFSLDAINEKARNKLNINSKLVGGNLTLLCNMTGTKLQLDTNNKILLVEDIGEQGYKIHRHLLQLHHSGLLKSLKAMIFADFTESDKFLEKTIEIFTKDYLNHIPVYRIKNIGHSEINHPITLNSKTEIINNKLIIDNNFGLI